MACGYQTVHSHGHQQTPRIIIEYGFVSGGCLRRYAKQPQKNNKSEAIVVIFIGFYEIAQSWHSKKDNSIKFFISLQYCEFEQFPNKKCLATALICIVYVRCPSPYVDKKIYQIILVQLRRRGPKSFHFNCLFCSYLHIGHSAYQYVDMNIWHYILYCLQISHWIDYFFFIFRTKLLLIKI